MPDELTDQQRRALIWDSTLIPEQREKLAELISEGKVTADIVAEMRRLCRTDLWYLGRHVIGNDWFTEYTHRPIVDFFVKKNPDLPVEDQDTVKERLLLYPRGSLKSTWNVVDTVQWILFFADITIVILTAADDLATDFVDEVKNYFACEFKGGKWERPTLLQALFPEFCVNKKSREKGASGEFTTPARKRFDKDPTVRAISIESNNAGKHCLVLKLDDAISDANSETAGQLRRLTKKISMAENLLLAGGYLDLVGTRYGLDDAYGRKLKTHGITEKYGAIRTEDFQYLCYPAWWVKGTNYQLPDRDQVLDPHGLEFLFPEKQGYRVLLKKYRDNEENFASQQLNDPAGAKGQIFTRESLVSATIPLASLPTEGMTFLVWDLAYGIKKWSDYTVGAVGLFDKQGRLWILDIIRGKFSPHELPYIIAKAIKDHAPQAVAIEDSVGAQWLKNDIGQQGKALGVDCSKIDWIPVNHAADAKFEHIRALVPWIANSKFFLSAGIDCLEDVYGEFERFNGSGSGHDDIPDSIAHLLRYAPRATVKESDEATERAYQGLVEREMHDRIFQIGNYTPREPGPEPEPLPEVDPYTSLPIGF